MGIYVNPGNEEFKRAANSKIYVDKTMLLAFTNQNLKSEHQNICVSRPRRFGKSMAANMLSAYYGAENDSHALFKPYRISKDSSFEEHINKYNVIQINMIDFMTRTSSVEEMIDYLQRRILWDLKKAYGQLECFNWNDLVEVLQTIYAETKRAFVIIIDEWDCIFRKYPNNHEDHIRYLDFLRFWLKGKSYIALAYMTGILPIKKYGEHSALNMFDEYSMTNQRELAEFTGFTEVEVQELCRQYDMPYDKTKQWYDGYDLKGVQIYNPRSVVMSMLGHDYDSYWTKTETYEALKKYIQMNQYGLKELTTRLIAGEHIPVNPDKFQNDMTTFASADDVLTLLIHLGYLTYDFYAQTVCIPNQEVQKEFINCIEDGGWEPVMAAIRQSEDLMEATLRGDEEYVAQQIQRVHEDNISILKYNDENSLACVLSLAYYAAKKTHEIYRELAGGKGFADLVFVPRKHVESPAMIVELKWDQSAQTALDQIREKKYDKTLKGYHGSMLLVGINYRKAEKTYTCRIETETINE